MRIKVLPARQVVSQQGLRVSAYVRVSSTSEELENSLENQKRHYQTYIQSNPEWQLGDIYADEGISGYFEARPGFQRMLTDARNRKFDMLIVKSISRFARNTETTLSATRELKRLGIGVFFELQNINTLSSAGELMLTIHSAFSQGESDSCSANAKLSAVRKFKSGQHHHATKRTYGYTETLSGSLVILEDEAQVVRLIYDLAEQGVWRSKIAQHLNNQGIPSPEGCRWIDTAIERILRSVTYKGDLILQKTFRNHRRQVLKNTGQVDQWYVAGNHPWIVKPEQWEAVQEVINHRNAFLQRELPALPEKSRSPRTRYPLTNMLYCSKCGEKLLHKWSNGIREYWVCKTNIKVSAAACKGIWLPANVANAWEINEPVTVVEYLDGFGMKHFTCYPKDEYEAFIA